MKFKQILSMLLIFVMAIGWMPFTGILPDAYAAYKKVSGAKINYALFGTATADDEEKSGATVWSASRAIDGVINRDETDNKLQSRWSTHRDTTIGERTLIVDLGAVRTFDEFVLEWERNNVHGFYIATSVDGTNYTKVHTRDSSLGNLKNLTYNVKLSTAVDARYVKLGVTKYVGWENVSLYEIMVVGTMSNIALSATAYVNGSETSNHTGAKAIDGIINRDESANNSQSRWSSNVGLGEDKWITLDFGKKTAMESAVIEWERLNATAYKIQYSDDNSNWTDIKSFSSLPTNFRQVINFDTAVYARYLRLLVTDFNEAGTSFTGGTTRWKNVSVWEFEVYPVKNLAYDAIASANASETADFAPSFANDGIVNRENTTNKEQSRWASSVGINEKWLMLDFKASTTISSVVIEWERLNATAYKLQYSQDGSTWSDIKSFTEKPSNYRHIINFPKVTARYIRLLITNFDAKASVQNGSTYTWETVSVYEFEAYPTGFSTYSLSEVAASLEIPKIKATDTKFTLPKVPSGFEIEFIGADYEQVIDSDLTIHTPIVDKNVKVNFRITFENQTLETEAFEITVPGKYTKTSADNTKPVVIPELAEWKGHSGNFEICESTRLVVNPIYKNELSFVAESFKADFEAVTKQNIQIVYSTDAADGDFYFTLGSLDDGLKEEGYIMTVSNFVTVEATHKTGAFWAVQTVMQILEKNDNTIPKGITRDYPKFKVRGFMLDVGRKAFTLDYLYDVVKTMAYYKLNDFGVHLNDNYIWLEDYNDTETDQWGGYSAFRLESDIKEGGQNKADLTSKDLYYTKDEFREFIQWSRNLGVNVVPEIDTPAHALALTKVRPDLAIAKDSVTRWADHMDLSKPETEQFVKSIWNEYITGSDPVFDKDTILNIGTDEYEGDNNDFRQYSANMINYVQGSGRTVRMWGSLSRKTGSVSVPSKDVQLYIWNTSWANPDVMYKDGYEIINIQDSFVYMVPNGTNNRGGYKDRLNVQNIYENWTPNTIGSFTVPSGSDKMLGGAFAIWNDNTDLRDNGLGEYDLFDRFFESAPYIASKCWGDGKDYTYSQFAQIVDGKNPAPNTNPYDTVNSKTEIVAKYLFNNAMTDVSANGYNAITSENVSYELNTLKLNGGKSYVATPNENIGPVSSITLRIKSTDASTSEQILMESENASIKAYQKGSGKFGYSRDGRDYSFNYTLPKNQWVEITIKGYEYKTELYADGVLVDTLGRSATGKLYATGVLPLERIGSKTSAFIGLIDEITVKNQSVAHTAWNFNSDNGTLTVYDNLGDFAPYNTPWYENSSDIKKVVIEEGVTQIGSWTFGFLKNVNKILLPSTIEYIGDNAFSGTDITSENIYYFEKSEQFDNIDISTVGNSSLNKSNVICLKDFVIRKASVTLNNKFSVNFKVCNYLFENEGYQNPVLTVNGKQISEYTVAGDYAVFTLDGIASYRIGDTLSATLTATRNGDTYTNSTELSIADYLETIINCYSDDEKLVTLAVDALNYAAAAQVYKNYKTDKLVNDSLTESQKQIRNAGDVANAISMTNEIEESVIWKKHGLYLEDSFEIKLSFDTDIKDFYVIVKDSQGNHVKTITEFYITPYGEYYFYFDGLEAHQLDDKFTFTVMKDGFQISEALTYSAASYISIADKDQKLSPLVRSLLAYGRSAYNYSVK